MNLGGKLTNSLTNAGAYPDIATGPGIDWSDPAPVLFTKRSVGEGGRSDVGGGSA